jgi:hypothetical protein
MTRLIWSLTRSRVLAAQVAIVTRPITSWPALGITKSALVILNSTFQLLEYDVFRFIGYILIAILL